MTVQTVIREDLGKRSPLTLSKSVLTTFDFCAQKAWFGLHAPLPLILTDEIVFGSAVDAAIEKVGEHLRSGQDVDVDLCVASALEVTVRDDMPLDMDEVRQAVLSFTTGPATNLDWHYSAFQRSLKVEMDGFGLCDGHPDIILADGSIWDVKTAKKSKPQDAAATSTELGWYALLAEAWTNEPVPLVGYLTYVRSGHPGWQVLSAPVTDELRRRTREVALAYLRARNADSVLNARTPEAPINWTFPSGPKFPGLCKGCSYNPANGGDCRLAYTTEEAAA